MLNLGPIRQLGLPVLEIADAVNRQLADAACLVVTAPPGAGKSTVLPLTILAGFVDGDGLGPKGSEMILLELGDGGSLRGTPLNGSGQKGSKIIYSEQGDGGSLRGTPLNGSDPKGSKIIPSELGDGGSLRGMPLNGSGQKGSKIIILEPRRIAARQIAERMAALLGEPVGRTVGYRIRFESRVSSATRIEVVTEGILTRMLVDDPALEGVGVVVFDEFHERSLASDVALALTREAQQLLRPDLRIVLMSATIDTEALCQTLDAPLIESAGRMFPVEIRHTPEEASQENVAERVAHWVRVALREHEGDVLAFLPGEAEIRRCAELLEGIGAAAGDSPVRPANDGIVRPANDGRVRPTRDEKVKTANDERVRPTTDGRSSGRISFFPLYGMLPPEQQRAAIAPSAPGARKVVLATPIAETSLTIEGVRVVVDGGFCRRMVFDPQNALSRLETVRISRDMADQRSGRAGRVAPGVCYRLWGRGTEARMAATRVPEILEADLAGTVLDAAAWGEPHPERLAWLTPPPAAHLAQASRLLELLGAVDADGRITRHGRDLAALPCHPRIAQLLLGADGPQERALAADIAALLEEKDPLAASTDDAALTMRLDALRAARRSSRGGRWSRILTIADQYASARGKTNPQRPGQDDNPAAGGKNGPQRPGQDENPATRGKNGPQRPGQDEIPVTRGKTSTQRPGQDDNPAAGGKNGPQRPGQDENPATRGKNGPQRPGQDEIPVTRGKTSTQRPGQDDNPAAGGKTGSQRPGQDENPAAGGKNATQRPGQDDNPAARGKTNPQRPGDSPAGGAPDPYLVGRLLAAAYPERVAKARGDGPGRFQLATGELAAVDPQDALAACDWLAVASLSVRPGALGRSWLAAPLDPEDVPALIRTRDRVAWDGKAGAAAARRERRIGCLLVDARPLSEGVREELTRVICEAAQKEGTSMLDFSDEVGNLQRRVAAVAAWHPELDLPDLSTEAVLAGAPQWLPPFIGRATTVAELKKIDLCAALWSQLDFAQQQAVDRLAPTHIAVPTGSRIRLEYRQGAEAPVLRVRLQECFGLVDTPRVDDGRRPVLMELLSPGFKPVQLTTDLRSFWSGTYFEVRKELRRRYPRHAWPDDPLAAEAVRGVRKKV